MDDMHTFYTLKQNILIKYREAFPFYTGSIQDFGNREIAQLIDLVERDCHERVSEKWVYTHLKPLTNQKLPRRDMLDIFCWWLGYTGWEEFIYKNKTAPVINERVLPKKNRKAVNVAVVVLSLIVISIISAIAILNNNSNVTVCFSDRYTRKPVDAGKLSVYVFDGKQKQKLNAAGSCYVLARNGSKIITESAYYKPDTITITEDTPDRLEIDLQPDDYAMMLRVYMNGNLADWKKRREQLDNIISDDAVIQEVMFEEIGVEFLDKQEFINKVTTPSTLVKNMEVIEIDYENGKIISLKYMQKEE